MEEKVFNPILHEDDFLVNVISDKSGDSEFAGRYFSVQNCNHPFLGSPIHSTFIVFNLVGNPQPITGYVKEHMPAPFVDFEIKICSSKFNMRVRVLIVVINAYCIFTKPLKPRPLNKFSVRKYSKADDQHTEEKDKHLNR
ncbi:hypothetical protein [Pseudocitrobacter faecalis]|uniref:hypothetical protein n=1 Tax=Pseudocitrobacter faecalis TaxID=1398493 RepID=UPI003BA34A85